MHTDKLSVRRVHTTDMNDMRGVDITSEIYKERYPYLYKTYTEDYNPCTKFWHNRVYVNGISGKLVCAFRYSLNTPNQIII